MLALAVIWKVVSVLPSAATAPTVMQKPPDDAAVLISNCGQPDADKLDTKSGEEARSMLYKKARVEAVFMRPDSTSQWKTPVMRDPKTLKPLAAETLAKRLPCAVAKTTPTPVRSGGR